MLTQSDSTFSVIRGVGCALLLLLLICVPFGNVSAAAGTPKKAPEKGKENKKVIKPAKVMSADEAEAAGLCPVCRKEHKLIYHAPYKEKKYHFCSRTCQQRFKKAPDKVISKKIHTLKPTKKTATKGKEKGKLKKNDKKDDVKTKENKEMDEMGEMDGE